jgi:hypothetical protein
MFLFSYSRWSDYWSDYLFLVYKSSSTRSSHIQPEKSEMLHYNPTNVEIQGVPAHTYEVSK